MIKTRLKEIEERKKEIRTILTEGKEADLNALETELRDLADEKDGLERRQSLLDTAIAINSGDEEARSLGTVKDIIEPTKVEKRAKGVDFEKRGKELKEHRTVTVASSNIILPTHESTTINGTFNQVSTLIDRVKQVPLPGGESYKASYEKGHGEGEYTEEGVQSPEADVEFGYANITKAKISSYSEESEEVEKLPNADYDSVIVAGVGKSLRRKITRQILVGDGGANHLAGIFSDKADAIDASTDLEISEITENTLDEIIYSFGGDEDVEDTAVLILNKNDVKAFAMLRNADGKKAYEVKSNGNAGTIDNVPYIINSACKAISNEATSTGAYCMAYGPLQNYELAIFSETDIKRSTESKFREGMIAHRGVVFVGGNVAAQNGFLRVKKRSI